MLFPTLDFALFFVIVFAAVWATGRHNEARKAILVVASYFFYMQWDWRFAGLLAGSSIMNWSAGLLIARANDERQKKLILGIAVALNLAVLGFFKYYDFFIGSFNDLMMDLGLERELPFMDIVLPVGISFFTFHGLSYIIDVKRGVIQARSSVLDLLLYISFFPQLVAGPIVRGSELIPQFDEPKDPRRIDASRAFFLIMVGLAVDVAGPDRIAVRGNVPAAGKAGEIEHDLRVLPRKPFIPGISHEIRGMKCGDKRNALIVKGLTANDGDFQLFDSGQDRGCNAAKGHNNVRSDNFNLPFKETAARLYFIFLRIAVQRRSAFDNIRNIHFLPLHIHFFNQPRKKRPGVPDKGPCLYILLPSRRFADKHKPGISISLAENYVGSLV